MIIAGPDAVRVTGFIGDHIYTSVAVALAAAEAMQEGNPTLADNLLADNLCDLMEAFIKDHKTAWTVCGDQDALIEAAIETGLVVSAGELDERSRR